MVGYTYTKKVIIWTNMQLRNPADFLDFLSMKLVKSNSVFYSKTKLNNVNRNMNIMWIGRKLFLYIYLQTTEVPDSQLTMVSL